MENFLSTNQKKKVKKLTRKKYRRIYHTNQKKKVKKLTRKKYRRIYHRFVAEGIKVVFEALKSSWDIEFVCISDEVKNKEEIEKIIELADKRGVQVLYSTSRDFKYMSEMETPEGILAVCKISDYKGMGKGKLPLIYLDRIGDPGNLGTIIRTAAWFGIDLEALWAHFSG